MGLSESTRGQRPTPTWAILLGLAVLALAIAFAAQSGKRIPVTPPSVPTPSASPVALGAGWDCRADDPRICADSQGLWFKFSEVSAEPYAACVDLLSLWGLSGEDHAEFDVAGICGHLYAQQ